MPEIADIVDIEEEKRRHKDEWLLFEIPGADDGDRSGKGRLLYHSKSRDEIHEVAMRKRKPGVCMMTVFTGPPVPPGTEFIP
jgi:hypothetical protein